MPWPSSYYHYTPVVTYVRLPFVQSHYRMDVFPSVDVSLVGSQSRTHAIILVAVFLDDMIFGRLIERVGRDGVSMVVGV